MYHHAWLLIYLFAYMSVCSFILQYLGLNLESHICQGSTLQLSGLDNPLFVTLTYLLRWTSVVILLPRFQRRWDYQSVPLGLDSLSVRAIVHVQLHWEMFSILIRQLGETFLCFCITYLEVSIWPLGKQYMMAGYLFYAFTSWFNRYKQWIPISLFVIMEPILSHYLKDCHSQLVLG